MPIRAPLCHKAAVPSKKYFKGAAIFPKRVGLPKAKPAQFSKSAKLAYMAPSSGIVGAVATLTADTGGTVRIRASIPSTDSIPLAIYWASFATAPVRL